MRHSFIGNDWIVVNDTFNDRKWSFDLDSGEWPMCVLGKLEKRNIHILTRKAWHDVECLPI